MLGTITEIISDNHPGRVQCGCLSGSRRIAGVEDSLDQAEPNEDSCKRCEGERSLSGQPNLQRPQSKRTWVQCESETRNTARPSCVGGTRRRAIATMLLAPMCLVGTEAIGAQVAPRAISATAGTYVALNPARIADTRSGSTYPDAGETLGAAGSINVQVAGSGGVPDRGRLGCSTECDGCRADCCELSHGVSRGQTQP